MSWYCGNVTSDKTFTIREHNDPSWLKGESITTQSGKTLKVLVAEAGDLFGIDITVDGSLGVATGGDVWFQLASVAAAAPAAAAPKQPDYPQVPLSASASAAYPKFNVHSTTGVTAQPAYPLSPLESSASMSQQPAYPLQPIASSTQPAYVAPAAASAAPSYPALPDDSGVFASQSSRGKKQRAALNDASESRFDGPVNTNNNDDGSPAFASSGVVAREALSVWLVVCLFLVAQMFICDAIGINASKWLLVLVWTLLGTLVVSAIQIAVATNFCATESSRMTRTVVTVSVLSCVWVNAFGIPIAWVDAQDSLIERMTSNSSIALSHCFRTPTQPFTTTSTSYILLQEPQWTLDYKNWNSQKIKSEFGTNDDGVSNGKSYNYCVAPLVYKGPVPCNYNLWAVCYFEGSATTTSIQSCSDADAVTCGWNFPANGVAIRTVVPGEAFFTLAEDEDIAFWQTAMDLASPVGLNAATTVGKTMVLYNSDSPDDLANLQPGLMNLRMALMIAMPLSFAAVALFVVISSYVKDKDTFTLDWCD